MASSIVLGDFQDTTRFSGVEFSTSTYNQVTKRAVDTTCFSSVEFSTSTYNSATKEQQTPPALAAWSFNFNLQLK
jgi:hypothetical protein